MQQKTFSEKEVQFYAANILLALEALHSHGITYRDLKPENILLGADGYLKLVDFGMSKMEKPQIDPEKFGGTMEYLAPEIIRGSHEGPINDWWAFGCVIYEIIVKIPPFFCGERPRLMQKILTENPKYP